MATQKVDRRTHLNSTLDRRPTTTYSIRQPYFYVFESLTAIKSRLCFPFRNLNREFWISSDHCTSFLEFFILFGADIAGQVLWVEFVAHVGDGDGDYCPGSAHFGDGLEEHHCRKEGQITGLGPISF